VGCAARASDTTMGRFASVANLLSPSPFASAQWELLPGATSHARAGPGVSRSTMTVLEVLIAFFLPPVSVAMKKGLSSKVLIALLLQLCGHIPGVIYGIYVVTQE